MVGVAVGYEDGSDRLVDRGQDLLGLPGVHDHVAFRRVDDVGVHLEAVHGEGDLLDLGHEDPWRSRGVPSRETLRTS